MLLLELVADARPRRRRSRIVGTDVSADALRAARPGDLHRPHPRRPRRRWCRTGGSSRGPAGVGGRDEAARELVELRLHNLVTEPPPFGPGEVDLVVCRNVTIYFYRATTRALVGVVPRRAGRGRLPAARPLRDAVAGERRLRAGAGRRRVRLPQVARRPARSPTHRRRSVPVRSTPPRCAPRPEPRASAAALSPGARRASRLPTSAAPRCSRRARPRSPRRLRGGRRGGRGSGRAPTRCSPRRTSCWVGPGRRWARTPRRSTRCARPSTSTRPPGDAHFLLAGALARLGQHGRRRRVLPRRGRVAAAPGRRRPARDLLGGRDLAELVDLCEPLADSSAALARRRAARPSGRRCRERLGHLRDGRPRDGRRPWTRCARSCAPPASRSWPAPGRR